MQKRVIFLPIYLTGNARFTPSHLHFGIYTLHGAIDPYPFVYHLYKEPEKVLVNTNLFGKTGIVKKKSWLYSKPDKKEQISMINKSEEFRITGGSGKFYKVMINESLQGYLLAKEVENSFTNN